MAILRLRGSFKKGIGRFLSKNWKIPVFVFLIVYFRQPEMVVLLTSFIGG